jgi:hypothetical protein
MGFQPKVAPTDCFQRKDWDQRKHIDVTGWFQRLISARPSSPPIFENFTDFWHTLVSPHNDSSTTPCIELGIYNVAPASRFAFENSRELITTTSSMAYQTANPQSFMPWGFEHLEVQGRRNMARFVVRREQVVHEEWAILSIEHLPLNVVISANIIEVSLEFLVQHKRVHIRYIQKTHLGQALVQFVHIYDQERLLISQNPHPYGDVYFSFRKHNEGRNWRQIEYNREVWLMLLGFPLDYLSQESIQHAIASFEKMLMWEEDKSNQNRLLVKECVTNLGDIPKHIVMSESDGFEGETWTIQCEIIHQKLLGAQQATK